MFRTPAGETMTPGLAALFGPCLCGGDLWTVPWYVVTMCGNRLVRTVRICDECENAA